MDATLTAPATPESIAPQRSRLLGALGTLVRRRFALTAHTPREIFVPLLTPILFAVVIAPALAKTVGSFQPGIDYMTFVALATAGLLIPLNTMFSGIGVIVDRESGSQRDLLAAPAPRSLMVLANLAVALCISLFQAAALIGASVLRGSTFSTSAAGWLWAMFAVIGLATLMHGCAEILAAKINKQEEYVGAAPPVALHRQREPRAALARARARRRIGPTSWP